MLVKFNDHSANERRRNAEVSYRDILNRRLNELNAGADAVQAATLRVFPNLFAAPTPVEAPAQTVYEAPSEIVEPVIETAGKVDQAIDHEPSEQAKRVFAARLATEEAHDEVTA